MPKIDLSRIFANPANRAQAVGIVVALLAMFGVPDAKQNLAAVIVGGVFVLLASALVADGYKEGKDREGTVPDGRKATGGTNIYLGGEPVAMPDVSTKLDDLPAPAAASPFRDGHPVTLRENTASDPHKARAGVGWGVPAVLLMLVAFVGGGCAATSPAYQFGAQASAATVVPESRDFVQADAKLAEPERSDRLAKVGELEAATASLRAVTLERSAAAWAAVKPFYVAYVRADTSLDGDQRQYLLDVAAKFDVLIEAERGRLARLLGLGRQTPAVGR